MIGSTRVLVIPGLNGDPGMLLEAAPRLFPGLRPVTFGHRLDVPVDGIDGLAERALAALDADREGDAPAYVCGESFGGTVALTIAHRRPERVRGLLLFSAFGHYPRRAYHGLLGAVRAWRLIDPRGTVQVTRASRRLSVAGQLGFRYSRDMLRAYLSRPASHIPAYRAKCELLLAFDARPWLPTLQAPALVVTGTFDPVVPTSAGRQLARLLPNARLHRLPGGHLVHLVRADQVGRLVAGWLGETA